jgi:hypothetical protein
MHRINYDIASIAWMKTKEERNAGAKQNKIIHKKKHFLRYNEGIHASQVYKDTMCKDISYNSIGMYRISIYNHS